MIKKSRKRITHKDVEDTDFEYVVTQTEQARICFGMTSLRNCLPLESKDMNTFMRLCTKDNNAKVGPHTYSKERSGALYDLRTKPGNKRGYGSLLYTAPSRGSERIEKRPGPAHYDISRVLKKAKPGKCPFNACACRFKYRVDSDIPPPTTYMLPTPKFKCQMPIKESFGGKRCPVIAVDCKCVPENLDLCKVCGETPVGDYFRHLVRPNTFICMKCIKTEPEEHLVFTDEELKQFKRLRDCSFMHEHNGTTAAFRLMTDKEIKKKLTLESYLSQYFPC